MAPGACVPVAVLLVIVAAPPTCSCTTKVPVFWIVALLIATLLMFDPETNWIASYGLCWIRMLSTFVRPVIVPSRASNHSAPTPNCQFGSRFPSRIRVLRSTSVRPSTVDAKRWATWMPPPWVRPASMTRLSVTRLSWPP